MELLTSFDISSIDALSLSGNKQLAIKFQSRKGVVQAHFLGLVYLNLSNDLQDLDDDELVVVEVCHERRRLEKADLQNYLFEVKEIKFYGTEFHVIQIHSSTVVEIICQGFNAVVDARAIV